MAESIDTPELASQNTNPLHEFVSGSTGAVVLVVLVLICYAMTSQFGYIWDDNVYVTQNALLRTFKGLSRIWTEPGLTPQYYPMTFTSFWAEVQAVGLNPKVSHVMNMLLHAGSVLILWQILRRLAVPGAWVAAAIFAVHPINVESVAWISERKNTLSLLFGLASTWLFLRYTGVIASDAPPAVTPAEGEPVAEKLEFRLPTDPGRLYALFLVTFVLGLLSKTTISVLPVVLGLILWWKNGRVTRKQLLALVPPLVLGAVGGAVTSYIEHNPLLVGASGPDWQVGYLSRILLAGQTACFYAMKLAVPYPLIFNYPKWTLNPANPLQWLPLVGVIGAVVGLFFAQRVLGRGAVAGVLIYLVCLLPASGLFMVYPFRFSWVADHFAYMASIGLITVVVSGLTSLLRRQLPVGSAIAALVIVAFGGLAVAHSMAFYDVKSIWEDTEAKNKHSWLAAVEYADMSRQRAILNYERAMALGDKDEAERQRQLGWKAAEAWFKVGLKRNPDSFEAYNGLGQLYVDQGKIDQAIDCFNKADTLAVTQGAESFLQPKFELAELFLRRGQPDRAQALWDELQTYEPKLAWRAPRPFAFMHTQMGDRIIAQLHSPIQPQMPDADRATLKDAMDQYITATELDPTFLPAKLKLAGILVDTNTLLPALQQINDVLEIDRDNVPAKMLSVAIAMKSGNYEAAVAQLGNILQTAPGYLPAHLRLAEAYKAMGRYPDAITELENTLKAVPNYPPAVKLLAEVKATAATQPATASTTAPAKP